MSDTCREFFETNYYELNLLFHINVVLLAFSLLVFVCVIVTSPHPLLPHHLPLFHVT